MPKTTLPDRIRTFLAQPQPAIIASVRPDGQPVSVATWYLLDGDEVLVNMDAGRRRLAYLRADPRVSLTVLDSGDWYTHVSLQGRIVRWRDDEGLGDIDDYPATTAVSRTQPGTALGSAPGSPSNGGTDGAACADSRRLGRSAGRHGL